MTYGWYKAFIICPRCFVSLVVEQFFSRKEKEKTTHWEQVASVNYILRFYNNLWLLLGYSQVLTSKWVYKRMDPSRMLLVGAHALARTKRSQMPVTVARISIPLKLLPCPRTGLHRLATYKSGKDKKGKRNPEKYVVGNVIIKESGTRISPCPFLVYKLPYRSYHMLPTDDGASKYKVEWTTRPRPAKAKNPYQNGLS